jgi:hypothetical protein
VIHRLDGRRSGGPPDETQLAEGLASAQDPEHTLGPRVRVLLDHLEHAAPDDEERIGDIALMEDGLARRERVQLYPSREVRQLLLGQVREDRQGVDQVRGLDPPAGLETEPQGLGELPGCAGRRLAGAR